MSRYFGVAPCASGWHIAVIDPPDSIPAPNGLRVADVPRSVAARGFFAWCDEEVRLATTDDWLRDEPSLVHELGVAIQCQNLAAVYHAQKNEHGWYVPDAVGICHPYATLPAVRRVLPVLFDGRAISWEDRQDLSRMPSQTKLDRDGARLFAIEAPLAGCLDLVARNRLALPAGLFVLTGGPAGGELTVVDVRREGDRLELDVRFSCGLGDLSEWSPSGGPRATLIPDCPCASASLQCAVYGRHLEPVVERIASHWQLPAGACLQEEESSLAVGAARYAALCFKGTLHGCQGDICRLQVGHVCPRGVGVLATGKEGGSFWHQVVPAGRRLPCDLPPLRVTGKAPHRVVFAERCGQGNATWLAQRQWSGHGLRWFGSAELPAAAEAEGRHLVLRWNNPSGMVGYGWSDLAITADGRQAG